MDKMQKQILDIFHHDIYTGFRAYCKQHQYEVTAERLITYLIDKQFIPEPTIRRYVIAEEFEREFPKHDKHKTETIQTLASRFHLSERTVWSALRQR